MSVTGTPMLKSVMVLMSKHRGRALARKSCPYLNKWVDPLFIDVPRGSGRSGDPAGLNSECSQWVDTLQVYRRRTANELMPRVPAVWCQGTLGQASFGTGDKCRVSLARRRKPTI